MKFKLTEAYTINFSMGNEDYEYELSFYDLEEFIKSLTLPKLIEAWNELVKPTLSTEEAIEFENSYGIKIEVDEVDKLDETDRKFFIRDLQYDLEDFATSNFSEFKDWFKDELEIFFRDKAEEQYSDEELYNTDKYAYNGVSEKDF